MIFSWNWMLQYMHFFNAITIFCLSLSFNLVYDIHMAVISLSYVMTYFIFLHEFSTGRIVIGLYGGVVPKTVGEFIRKATLFFPEIEVFFVRTHQIF